MYNQHDPKPDPSKSGVFAGTFAFFFIMVLFFAFVIHLLLPGMDAVFKYVGHLMQSNW